MKKSLVFITVICCLLISNGVVYAGYIVNDAGVTEANGLYCETGEISNQRPVYVYQLGDTIWEIWHINGFWYIDDERQTAALSTYYISDLGATPPLIGWSATRGNSPSPTLSQQPCSQQSIPTLNEWGMILMSLMLLGLAFWMMKRRQMS